MPALARVFRDLFARVTGNMTFAEVRSLLLSSDHSHLVERRRAGLIISRVRIVAVVFGIFTPLWILIDMILFPASLWAWLALLRLAATGAFLGLALSFGNSERMSCAYWALALLLATPTVFFLASHGFIAQHEFSGIAATIAAGYAFLPFVMIAGLSVFPITAREGLLFGVPMLAAQLYAGIAEPTILELNSFQGAMWLLSLLLVVATMAGMSQLHFMMALVNQASHDGLTATFTRRVGEELVQMHFEQARRSGQPLSVAFIDLDDFKSINDSYSHEHGDAVLAHAARTIQEARRRHDILVRWGGEEFLLVMPDTSCPGATTALERLRASGLGMRPDGKPVTASIGIADSIGDDTRTWEALVALADERMYLAKRAGKDRIHPCCPQGSGFGAAESAPVPAHEPVTS